MWWRSNKPSDFISACSPSVPLDQIFQFSDTTKASSERSRLLLLGGANDGATEAWVKIQNNGPGLFWSLGDWPHLREACDEASWRSELCRSLASPYPGFSIPLVHSFRLVASLSSTNVNINPFPANTHLGCSVVKVQLVRTLPSPAPFLTSTSASCQHFRQYDISADPGSQHQAPSISTKHSHIANVLTTMPQTALHTASSALRRRPVV